MEGSTRYISVHLSNDYHTVPATYIVRYLVRDTSKFNRRVVRILPGVGSVPTGINRSGETSATQFI